MDPGISDGSVAFSHIYDLRDANGKDRRVIVVKLSGDGDRAFVVSVTTQYDKNDIKDYQVVMPFGHNSKTGFTKPCVADCRWISIESVTNLKRVGHVPTKLFAEVIKRVKSNVTQADVERARAKYRR